MHLSLHVGGDSNQHLYGDSDVESPKDHHGARHRYVDERFSSGAQSVVVLAHPVALTAVCRNTEPKVSKGIRLQATGPFPEACNL